MQQLFQMRLISRLVAFVVLVYGIEIITGSLLRELHLHPDSLGDTVNAIPLLAGLGCIYLANLLRREKYNAWVCAVALFVFILAFNAFQWLSHDTVNSHSSTYYGFVRFALPVLVLFCLLVGRSAFRVQSDMRSFKQSLRVSLVLLLCAFLYGVGGFMLLDTHDFHQEISFVTAVHQTIDQFGVTTQTLTPHSKRARLFETSLFVVSVGAVVYAVIALFQPLRMSLVNQDTERAKAEKLLERCSTDIDDFFKLWPHDKLYYFNKTETAGLAYHVSRGVALVVGDPFGERKQFASLLEQFNELCFVNDWTPAFVHVSDRNEKLYQKMDFRLQKIGEEAVLDLADFQAAQTGKSGKYFRQIRNRFIKLGYIVEVLQPPHSLAILDRLRDISDQWLVKPGRAERGFMLGYHNDDYFQRGPLVLVSDEAHQIQGFINVVPTFKAGTANYDLLRCTANAPGNCNDFLMLGLIDHLVQTGYTTLNLGLSPLAGLDDPIDSKDKTIVDSALRFVYSNGDRLYSFSGLHRFKEKYKPAWEDRFIAFPGGVRTFTRVITALNRAMKVK